MKIISTICVLTLLIVAPAHSQTMQTLITGDVSHGGFGGPVVKFSDVNGDLGVWVGGRGGWIIGFDKNHSISIGGGGYGLTTQHRIPDQDFLANPNVQLYAAIGYGGLELEYTNRSSDLVHFTATTLIGAGGFSLREDDNDAFFNDGDAFFVFEPGIHLELNVTTFFRISTGISYRLTSGIDKAGFKDSDFSGVNGVLTFKFGSFR